MEIQESNNNITKESKTAKLHVAVLPSPGMGHIIPLLEFAKQLVTLHGFHVTFLIFSSGSSPAQTQLLNSPSIPSDLDIVYLPEVEIPPFFEDETLAVHIKLGFIVSETITKFLKPALMSSKHGLPKALVVDMFCVNAFDTGKELSIPSFLFFTASASLLAWLLYFPTFDQSVNGDFSKLPETVITPGCDKAFFFKDLTTLMDREGISSINRFVEAGGILLNSWDDLEKSNVYALRNCPFYVDLKTPPIYSIGPLIKSQSNDDYVRDENGLECLKWLNDQPENSVLFVSFGSGGTLTNEQMIELAYGLEQSKQRFIWVVKRPSNVSKSGSFFNVGVDDNDPKAYLPDGFLKKTETVGKIMAGWAPQLEVLSHASTGGFLTHCGWNSFMESAVNGVPMICWPLFADQMMNASMISDDFGVGVRVAMDDDDVTGRDDIERIVRAVMVGEQGKDMRCRASVLQKSALESRVGAALDTLSSLVETWTLVVSEKEKAPLN